MSKTNRGAVPWRQESAQRFPFPALPALSAFSGEDIMMETDAMVFVVDDDAPMRESLRNLIRSVGLRVELFSSAQEFLESNRPFLQPPRNQ
jgi:PleD family two-component response regulator